MSISNMMRKKTESKKGLFDTKMRLQPLFLFFMSIDFPCYSSQGAVSFLYEGFGKGTSNSTFLIFVGFQFFNFLLWEAKVC